MSPSADIRAVLFDAAGTLIRVREPVGETYSRVAAEYGVSASATAVDRAFRHVLQNMPAMVFTGSDSQSRERRWWSDLVRQTFAAAAPNQAFADFDTCFDRLFAHYAHPGAWVAASGAHSLLAALRKRGLRTGIVSNFDYRLDRILAGLSLLPLLEVVVRPADAGAAKPDARIFGVALERLRVGAHESAYVGDDHDQDVAAAEAAGMVAIDVTRLDSLDQVLGMVAH